MKNVRLILVLAVALCGSTANVSAHGCGWGFHCGIPFVSFGFGFGLGASCGWPAYGWGCGYPAYVYTQPAYAYTYTAPAACYAQPATVAMPAAPDPAPIAPAWGPSTPGAGHWVPEPKPYSYTQGEPTVSSLAKAPPVAQPAATTVNKARSAGDVPVYIVSAQ